MKVVHDKINPCRKNYAEAKNSTLSIDEVTCLKCISKMNTKPSWFIRKEGQDALDRKLNDSRRGFVPVAEVIYNVGDMAYAYNSSNVLEKITHTYDEGKFIQFESGRISAWYEIKTKDSEEAISLFSEKRPARINYSNSTLESLFSKKYSFGLDMNPYYQRDLVWSQEQKVALIDSIFREIEIGRFLFKDMGWRGENKESYEIVDGKQRLTTIFDFIENKFSYKGVFYKDLSRSDVRRFRDLSVVWGTLRENTTEQETLDVFIKLNTHGVVMSDTHLDKIKDIASRLQGDNNGK